MQTRPLRVTVLNWRDTTHPEGGGSERYIERIAADLVADGCQVDILCSAHPGVGPTVVRDGITFRHAGNRWSVYARALGALLRRRLAGRGPDVVIDVHNGIPFFARLVAGCPVVVLVHHVHREQWGVVFGRRMAALGWAIESRLSPLLHRGCQYIAVSQVTRRELAGLGVDEDAVAVVHNGTRPVDTILAARTATPSMVVLGRLVPHKRVEHALTVLARLAPEFPQLRLTVVGEGWWHPELVAEAERLGVTDRVAFTGFVDEDEKESLLARSWVMLAPSVKEGWGLMVVEAAAHAVPSIAYRSAGGLAESIRDGRTGVLVEDDLDAFVAATRAVLQDDGYRLALGEEARRHVACYSWRTASTSMHLLLRRAANGLPPTSVIDPTAAPDQPATEGVRIERRPDGSVVVDLRDPHEPPPGVELADGIDTPRHPA